MQRRTFLAALAVAPVIKDIKHPTEAQLAGMSEEEYGATDSVGLVQCSICSTEFDPTDEQVVVGMSARLIVACPSCRVLQMVGDAEVPD